MTSYGIICVNHKAEVLLVQRRMTYAYEEFILDFHKRSDISLRELFNNMTEDEKYIISSGNYEFMWCRMFNSAKVDIINNEKFKQLAQLFNIKFADKKYLDSLLSNTRNISPLWMLPRGKKEPNETCIEAAIREFIEETGVPERDINILSYEARFNIQIKDVKNYDFCFYMAQIKHNSIYINKLGNKYQPSKYFEIRYVKWVNIAEVGLYLGKKYENFIKETVKQFL
jgi:8-oxo-dGTP pyrophosphatase MutT (NUDIX family)